MTLNDTDITHKVNPIDKKNQQDDDSFTQNYYWLVIQFSTKNLLTLEKKFTTGNNS